MRVLTGTENGNPAEASINIRAAYGLGTDDYGGNHVTKCVTNSGGKPGQ